MDKRIDKFIFCVCHTRKTVQASGSPMFFLLLRRPPTLGDHTDGVWATLARAWARSSRGDGRTVGLRTSASHRGRRHGSAAAGAGRRRRVARSRRRQVAPARPRSSRGDERTAVLPTSASRRGRRRWSAAAGAGRRWPAGRSRRRSVPPAQHRSSRGDVRTAILPTSARAADLVAGPRPRERAVGGLQAVPVSYTHLTLPTKA